MKDFIGYDTVVMNWLISLYGGRGFLYGVHNNELFNLNYAAEFIESTEVKRKPDHVRLSSQSMHVLLYRV